MIINNHSNIMIRHYYVGLPNSWTTAGVNRLIFIRGKHNSDIWDLENHWHLLIDSLFERLRVTCMTMNDNCLGVCVCVMVVCISISLTGWPGGPGRPLGPFRPLEPFEYKSWLQIIKHKDMLFMLLSLCKSLFSKEFLKTSTFWLVLTSISEVWKLRFG